MTAQFVKGNHWLEPIWPSPDFPRDVCDLADSLPFLAGKLAGSVAPETSRRLGTLMRLTNSYYSNLIEGQYTEPAQMSQRMKRREAKELGVLALTHIQVQEILERKQQIICSRSFGAKVFSLESLQGAVASFVGTAAGKLRAQGSLANCLQVFARTSHFGTGQPYSGSRIVALPYPTDDTRDLLAAAMFGLTDLYRDGVPYAKAGIVLTQFVERGATTGDLFAPKPRAGSEAVMRVMDAINAKQGRGAVRLARDSSARPWAMRQDMLSPAFTTTWQGLPRARC